MFLPDPEVSGKTFSQEITKIDKKSSVRLFSQEITKIDKKSSVRLLSQEITKLDKKFFCKTFFTGDHNFTRIIQ